MHNLCYSVLHCNLKSISLILNCYSKICTLYKRVPTVTNNYKQERVKWKINIDTTIKQLFYCIKPAFQQSSNSISFLHGLWRPPSNAFESKNRALKINLSIMSHSALVPIFKSVTILYCLPILKNRLASKLHNLSMRFKSDGRAGPKTEIKIFL